MRMTAVFQNRFQLFIVHDPLFHFTLYFFAKIAFCAVQIPKGKLTFRKIETMQPYGNFFVFNR